MVKWEYRAVAGLTANNEGLLANTPAIWNFTVGGIQIGKLKNQNEVAQAIAQPGEQGWEMVGCGNIGDWVHALYFKRPKP